MKHISSFRALKGIVALMLLSMGASMVHAQTQYYINVSQKDGARVQYAVKDVNKVTVVNNKQPQFKDEFVDLGLSVKWATCNMGAVSPEDYGTFFNWGDTEELTKGVSKPYKWYDALEGKYTKYNLYESQGSVDMLYRLEAEDDIATVGGSAEWRIPTDDEFQELLEQCSWEWTDSLGIEGYLVTSKINGNSIFLPAAGIMEDGELLQQELKGAYLSNTLSTVSIDKCRILDFGKTAYDVKTSPRNSGYSVRAVYSTVNDVMLQLSGIELNTNSVEMLIGDNYNLNVKGVMANKTVGLSEASWQTSDAGVATVANGVIKAVAAGKCTITATFNALTATCQVNVQDPADPVYVDLGLSVRWATYNVGATKPEGYGNYYAWGETASKANYTWSTYDHCDGASNLLTKYCFDANGKDSFKDNKYVLETADDVAQAEWGSNWRMPMSSELKELLDSCDWNLETLNGINGYRVQSLVKGFEDKSIFIPKAGYKYNTGSNYVGSYTYMWSSSLDESVSINAYCFSTNSWDVVSMQRYYGMPVRPVFGYDIADIKGLGVNSKELSLSLNGVAVLEAYPLNGNGRRIGLIESISINWSSSNEGVATVLNGTVSAVAAGTCTITASYGGYNAVCTVTVKDPAQATPQSVDLGLSVKWATFNLGAFAPEMVGDYYAWGETAPYYEAGYAQSNTPVWKTGKNSGYDFNSYFDTDDGGSSFNKYFVGAGGKTVLDLTEDAANVNWNGTWRIPSMDEFRELYDNCTWEWTELNGVQGYRITSNVSGFESNSIFLPSTAYRSGTYLDNDFSYGCYWTRTLFDYDESQAIYLYIDEGDIDTYYDDRNYGYIVRPVTYFDDSSIQNYQLNYSEKKISVTESLTLNLSGLLAGGRKVALGGEVTWSSNNNAVATVSGGVVSAVSAGNATITATYKGTSKTCAITVVDPYNITPEYVNLGLSVNWAKFNLGAYAPEMLGDFFAWGETEPYYEAGQAQSYSPTWKSSYSNGYSWSSYFDTSDGGSSFDTYYKVGGLTELALVEDAANVNWGGTWRMPSPEEFNELFNKCTWSRTIQNGIYGYLITSNVEGYTDKSIFIPVGGYRQGSSWYNRNYGYYWTNALSTSSDTYGRYFYIDDNNSNDCLLADYYRYNGSLIRPVCDNDGYVDHVLLTDNITVLATDYDGGTRHLKAAARTVTDPADALNQCIAVTTNSSYYSNSDAQLLIFVDEDLKAGDYMAVSMRCKAAAAQNIRLRWQNNYGSDWNNYSYSVKTEWNYIKKELRISEDNKEYKVFAIDLSYLSSGNTCYFDDISVSMRDPWQGDFTLSDEAITMKIGTDYGLDAYDMNDVDYVDYIEWTSSNEQVVSCDNGYLFALSAGTSTVTATYRGVTRTCTVTVPEYEPVSTVVDLGLSVNWATCNIGANIPSGKGFYYAWGETKFKSEYELYTYSHYDNDAGQFTKYVDNPYYGYDGIADYKTVLDATDDVASVLLGGNWRMASPSEFEELINKCNWVYTSENGVWGFRITSTIDGYTDRSIFLPFAGYKRWSSFYSTSNGYYLSRSMSEGGNCQYARVLYMSSGSKYLTNQYRYYGSSVRPVTPNANWPGITTIEFDYVDISVQQFDSRDLDAELTLMSGTVDYSFMTDVIEWTSSNPDVATVDKNGHVVALATGNTTITASYKSVNATCNVTVTAFAGSGTEYGKPYVDLGLPSGTKWATCNVGANSMIEPGDYFAWGETEPYYTAGGHSENPTWKLGMGSGYSQSNYFDYYGDSYHKYYSGGKEVLDAVDDVAHVKWGGNWRMPTRVEQDELRNYCTYEKVTINGVKGYRFTSTVVGYTDRWIFLPFAGYRNGTGVNDNYCYYWSSSLYSTSSGYCIYISSNNNCGWDWNSRNYGYLVRPVCP